MVVDRNRETFIPYSRADVIELCLQDNRLPPEERQHFREFCHILAAYYHFKFHTNLELLKQNYTIFNPDLDTKSIPNHLPDNLDTQKNELIATFQHLLEKANYTPITPSNLRQSLQQKSLLELTTHVDLNDFSDVVCYCRGNTEETKILKKFYFWQKHKTIELFKRVAVLIKFKDKKYFLSHEKSLDELNFQPGKIYVYLYKNIPKFDLEFLFPNVEISMNWKDRLLFGVPAVGAAVPMVVRILPQFLLIMGIIFYAIFGHVPLNALEVKQEDIQNIMPILVATLSVVITCGGFAFRQYTSYKSKQIKFQKNVTEILFYRQIANNLGVFQTLIDAAEEEECKEVILAYYHLLTHSKSLTVQDLDEVVENWMTETLETQIDFDIQDAVNKLKQIKGANGQPLLFCDRAGYYHVVPLAEARKVIDYVWDRAFNFT